MLEPEMTYAELVVKRIKESRKKNKPDYVHPKNDIKDGFVIINYKKRNMEWKELMDGRLRMMVPEDWEMKESGNDTAYRYESPEEKERMTLVYSRETAAEDAGTYLKNYEENPEMPLAVMDSMEIPQGDGSISCSFLQDGKDTFFGLFFCRMGEGTLQGLFAMHRYRKKAWKHIIPQMLGTMEILTDKAGENEKHQKPQEGTGERSGEHESEGS